MAYQRVGQRLARKLIDLAGRLGVDTVRGTLIQARLTQQELAEMIGTTREALAHTLSDFRRRGLLDTAHHEVVTRDAERLCEAGTALAVGSESGTGGVLAATRRGSRMGRIGSNGLRHSSNRLPTVWGDGSTIPFTGRCRRMANMIKAPRAPLIAGGSLAMSLVLATAGVALGAPNPESSCVGLASAFFAEDGIRDDVAQP